MLVLRDGLLLGHSMMEGSHVHLSALGDGAGRLGKDVLLSGLLGIVAQLVENCKFSGSSFLLQTLLTLQTLFERAAQGNGSFLVFEIALESGVGGDQSICGGQEDPVI